MPGQVRVCDPLYRLDDVRALLAPVGVGVERGRVGDPGDDVVGLLVGIDDPVDEVAMAALPALRAVATCSVGFDHIDMAAAARRGVVVCNVPDYCVEEMADSAVTLVLALLRGVVELDRSVRAGRWDLDGAGPLRRIAGTRLGVVGFGRIGRAVARRAVALGMEAWAADPVVPAGEIAAAGARPAALDELLAACQAVSLHMPLTTATAGLIDRRRLALMPPGAVLVNTARGALLDDEAVLAALDDGQLFAAGLDVYAGEPNLHPGYRTRRNCFLLPHLGSATIETRTAMGFRCLDNLDAVLAGRAAPDALN